MTEILGMYPSWYVPAIGSAWVMGIIGTIHVLASHTSVGASWLFALLETKAYQENKPYLMDFIKKYGMFLLVFSYIIGSITGPGIWYAITVASPRGVGGLIHNFVWVWAAEWVYFTVEVIGVYAMVYTIGKVDKITHLKLTWSFALASWATMLLIVGILSFMMWPGNDAYYETGSSLDAFFNQNFFAHLGVRTTFMFAIAGVVGTILASKMDVPEQRKEIARFLAKVGIAGALGTLVMFMWYIQTLPENAKVVLTTQIPSYFAPLVFSVYMGVIIWLAFVAWQPQRLTLMAASIMTAILAIGGLWPEERTRESMRKPFVAGQYIYSNQVIARDVPGKGIHSEVEAIAEHGLLKLHPWIPDNMRNITDENKLEVGRLLTVISCSNCHSVEPGAHLRSLSDKFNNTNDVAVVKGYLGAVLQNGLSPYMPKIALPEHERDAIATYIASLGKAQPQGEQ